MQAGCGFHGYLRHRPSSWKLLLVFCSWTLYACVVYKVHVVIGLYRRVRIKLSVCMCVCVRERELESPWVLFVLIKQQLYGTLDTLDQTPSHYWNITPPQARGLQPVDVCTCQRCVRLHTSTGVSSDAFSYTQLGVWWSMHAAMNSSMCVYPWCCQHPDSPFTIYCLCLLSKCWCSHRSPSCREDIVICEGLMSLRHTATEHVQTQPNKTVHQLSQYRKEFKVLPFLFHAVAVSKSTTVQPEWHFIFIKYMSVF